MSRKTRYKQICREQNLPVFFQPWWLDMTGMNWDAVIVEDKDRIEAVWPYTAEHKAGMSITRNPLFTPYLGPFFFLQEENENKRLNKEDKIYIAIWEQMPAWDFFEVQCIPGYNNFLPLHHKGFECRPRITYHIDLKEQETALFAKIEQRKRTYIRNAEKSLQIVDGQAYIKEFYRLHKDTISRKGQKYPYEENYFERLVTTCLQQKAGWLKAAISNTGELNALLFTVYDNQAMYLLISAINHQAEVHNGAMPLLVWEAIKQAKSMGLSVFDFEGSMDKGVELFFRSFGGNRIQYLDCSSNKSTIWKLKKAILG